MGHRNQRCSELSAAVGLTALARRALVSETCTARVGLQTSVKYGRHPKGMEAIPDLLPLNAPGLA